MHYLPCYAKTALGPCLAAPVEGKKRCYRHGGAPGSGAPKGSQNAFKHGYYTKESKEEQRQFNRRLRALEEGIKALKGAKKPGR